MNIQTYIRSTAILLIIFIASAYNLQAQSQFPPERIKVVASLDKNKAKSMDVPASDLGIDRKVIRSLQLDATELDMVNPSIELNGGKGWQLSYNFVTADQVGIYQETLTERNGQLIITESRSAQMCMATNCEKVEFTDDDARCECVDKKYFFFKSEVTHRLFTSIR